MDDNQKDSSKTKVGFPDAPKPQKSGYGKVIILVVIILLILGGATWYLLSRREQTIEFTNDSVTPVVTEATSTPEVTPTIDKATLKIQIQNGTGTSGDAGKMEKALNDLGYSGTSTGNAANYDYTSAEVTFGPNFPAEFKQEILDKLNTMYSSVKEGNVSLGNFDAIVITGIAGGSKKTASITPTKKLSPTPTTKAKSTVSPTP